MDVLPLYLWLWSVSLGVLNPLPLLPDGGHLMYYLWEWIGACLTPDNWSGSAVALQFSCMMSIAPSTMSPGLSANSSPIHAKEIQSFVRAVHGAIAVPVCYSPIQPGPLTLHRSGHPVEGLQRVELRHHFASLLRAGETYNDDDKGSSAICALFGLAFLAMCGLKSMAMCWL
jgi:membrane-associated protease RseP (regulator of RpoE activity)